MSITYLMKAFNGMSVSVPADKTKEFMEQQNAISKGNITLEDLKRKDEIAAQLRKTLGVY